MTADKRVPLPPSSRSTICTAGTRVCSPAKIINMLFDRVTRRKNGGEECEEDQVYGRYDGISGGHDDREFKAIDVSDPQHSIGVDKKIIEMPVVESDPELVKKLEKLKQSYGCKDEKCVLQKAKDEGDIEPNEAKEIINTAIKPAGPTDNTWFNDKNIMDIMRRWESIPEYKFCALNFAMLDWESNPEVDGLAQFNAKKICDAGYKCFGCVCNTDKWSGGGKHWVSIFGDMRDDNVWTIEFFNSTGRTYNEFVKFTVKAANDINQNVLPVDSPIEVKHIVSNHKMHQQSNSECGAYALYYIWARMTGIPYTFFDDHFVPDSVMLKFRSSLFYNNK